MIGKSYFLLSLLQAGLAQNWEAKTPREVTAQKGSCAQIPCHYRYPSKLVDQHRNGIWFNNKKEVTSSIAFHSQDHSQEAPHFHHRTRLFGRLKDGDCSLIINNIGWEDAGPYFFRVEFEGEYKFSYRSVTQLHVSDFTDKPMISPVEIIAGKRVNLSCTFNTTCNGTAPALTWDTPTAVPGSVSNTVTQRGVTLTYTSVLSLTPSLRHHGQTLTCRVRYPTVSSKQTFVLTVQYPPQNLSITSIDGIKDSTINIMEGKAVVIICSVESFPASNLIWGHLNATMNRTSSNNELWLKISHVTYRDSGDYRCVAKNEHGTVEGSITITVEYPPQNLSISSLDWIQDSSINIIEGKAAVMICSVNSFPASNLTWRHLNATMNRTNSDNVLWLEIPHVTYRETGDYQCMAENDHGAVEGSITIAVQYPPRQTTVSISGPSGGIREGHNVTLTCSSEGVPPISHYTWFRIEGNTSARLNTSSRILSFTPVTRGNDASFYCTVTNPLGNSSSDTIHLNVEYGPEISQESECAQTAEGITCVCVANSNPPGDLIWHLPHAIINGNQTHRGFVSHQLREGQLVKGSLILMGHEDEEEVRASCFVQNPHGAAIFNVYLWVKDRDSNKWTVGLIMAGILFSVFLAGILIFLYVQKRKTATGEAVSNTSDLSLIYSRLSEKHQDPQNIVVTDSQNTTRDTASEGETLAPQDVSEWPVGGDAAHHNRTEDILYANINFSKLPSSDGVVHRGENTEYALIRFQPN
ncbi:sialic acid-binding Ig-like lectin 10 [Stegostoma tigrinum]|uniref:sialic acid-binding Ig-like lectin 10 n=1 Tax=Stegostoma tigrinum TaxID=3053191 RepID=UPI0028705BCC|nr:sialic acid-binding Ig-like lectin 10 [Stegostoma tigrinum]